MKNEKLTFYLKSPEPAKRKPKSYKKGILMALAALFILVGCNTYKKQLMKFDAFADAHSVELAKKCVQYFPVKDSVGKAVITVDSTHRAANTNYQSKIDSLQQIADAFKTHLAADTAKGNPCASIAKYYNAQVDALTNRVKALKQAYRPCIPDTVFNTKTVNVYQTDEAALSLVQNHYNTERDSLNVVKGQLKSANNTASSRLKWIFILGGILLGLAVLTVLKFIGKI
jgi:uncharacterized lipoprotein NlpE involved in copper resistance